MPRRGRFMPHRVAVCKGFRGNLAFAGLQKMERVKGIEPSSSAWKAVALPLSYTREPALFYRIAPLRAKMVGEVGLEPTKA